VWFFAYFGEVASRILYDNTKIAVAKFLDPRDKAPSLGSRILGGKEHQQIRAFSELQSYYLFADGFARPARRNDKSKVEGLAGYARRNFMATVALKRPYAAYTGKARLSHRS